jgi:hypothetical protein
VISATLTDCKERGITDIRQIRRALRDAYPFGERARWPYKVWCDEVRRWLGLPRKPLRKRREAPPPAATNQIGIFDG